MTFGKKKKKGKPTDGQGLTDYVEKLNNFITAILFII
jgi:hypothetical protein